MNKLLASLILASIATSANAWGDREQGALLGAIIGGAIVNGQTAQHQHRYYPQPPVYVVPPVNQTYICGMNVVCPQQQGRTCLQHPVTDQYGRVIGYQLSCH